MCEEVNPIFIILLILIKKNIFLYINFIMFVIDLVLLYMFDIIF